MTDALLNSLLISLQCTHIVVHAPSWFANLLVPPAAEGAAEGIDSLTRQLLWSMARENDTPQVLNRMRLRHGGPILPYRVLFCPLVDGGKTIGLVAAIRLQAQPEFVPADMANLIAAVPGLQDLLCGLRRP